MYGAVVSLCDKRAAEWSGFAPFADTYIAFKAAYSRLPTIQALQNTAYTGFTERKQLVREALSDVLVQVANILELYGKLHQSPDWVKGVKTSLAALRKMSGASLIGFGTKLLGIANGLPPADLGVYGMSAGLLANAAERMKDFTEVIDEPAKMQAQSRRGTQELAAHMASMSQLLERLDIAARILERSQPDFCGVYRICRVIIDPSFHKRELTVKVTHVTTGQPITGAEALVTPGDIRKKTGAGGGFYIKKLDDGLYNLKLTCDGYQPQDVSFRIVGNKSRLIEVTMEP